VPSPVAAVAATVPAASTASALGSTRGTITVPESSGGHRLWVDKHIIGESPGTFTVRCGWRNIQLGSQGQAHNVNVPCGGDILVRY
jgi:hypothetical protein